MLLTNSHHQDLAQNIPESQSTISLPDDCRLAPPIHFTPVILYLKMVFVGFIHMCPSFDSEEANAGLASAVDYGMEPRLSCEKQLGVVVRKSTQWSVPIYSRSTPG